MNDFRYRNQPAPDTFTYSYPVVTVPGDEIEVTASCVLFGSLSQKVYNTGPGATTPLLSQEIPPTQKAAGGLVPFLGAAAGFLVRRK